MSNTIHDNYDSMSETSHTPNEITSRYRVGRSKMRFLGLSDPVRGLQEAKESFQLENSLERAIKILNSGALSILGESPNPFNGTLEQPVLLVRDDEKLENLMRENGISYKPFYNTTLFDRVVGGYDFAHRFMSEEGSTQSLSSVHISGKAIDDTVSILGESGLKNLEKSLGALFLYANHDYTMHRHGMALSDDYGLSTLIGKQSVIDLPSSIAGVEEVLSAMFHVDMLRESAEHGMKLYESIEKQAGIALTEINKIDDENLKKYWMMIIKYPLFSLIDPSGGDESKEEGSTIVDQLREDFPELNLKATRWGKAIHQKSVNLSIGSNGETQEIDTRSYRRIVIDGMRTRDPLAKEKLAAEVGKRAGYRGEIKDWDDLKRISKARGLKLPDEATEEQVNYMANYHNITQRLDLLIKKLPDRDYDVYSLEDLQEKVKKYKALGFDFSGYQYLDWDDIFLKGYIKKYEELYENYLEDEDKNDLYHAFNIEELLEKAKKKGIDIPNTSAEKWYKENNKQILINLRKHEAELLNGENTWDFYGVLDLYLTRNSRKMGEEYDFEEFANYAKVRDLRAAIYNVCSSETMDSHAEAVLKDIQEKLKKVEEGGGVVGNVIELISMYFGVKSEIELEKLENLCRKPMSTIDEILVKNILNLYCSSDFNISHFKEYLDISNLQNNDNDERLQKMRDCILEMKPGTDWNAEHSADMQYIHWELSKLEGVDDEEIGHISEIVRIYFDEINIRNFEILESIAADDTNDLECRLIEVVLLVYYKEGYDISGFGENVDISFMLNDNGKKAA